MENEEDPHKPVMIFGQDVSQIPCFRNSFLYGISGGMGVGVLAFLKTSKPQLASHIGFGSFFCGTMGYWMYCRYTWSKRRFEYQQLQAAMKNKALFEGTDVERQLDIKTV